MNQLKKFLLNIAYFLLLVYLFTCVLFLLPVDKQYAYHYIDTECSDRSGWIYDRVFINQNPVQIAFIGSSRIKSVINEDLFEEKIKEQNLEVSVANFGYCRYGRNLEYAVLKDILKHKKLKYLVLEIREEEEVYSHVDFKYIADSRDILLPVTFFNFNILKDIFYATIMRLEYFKLKLLGPGKTFPVNNGDHSFTYSEHRADTSELAAVKRERSSRHYTPTAFEDWLNNKYPLQYVDKILSLAKDNNCKVFFLYLPGFGSELDSSKINYYKQYAKVFIPPGEILNDYYNWSDRDHMNGFGAAKISTWFVAQLLSATK